MTTSFKPDAMLPPLWGVYAILVMPLCYVAMFVIFGVALSVPQGQEMAIKLAYIAQNQYLISLAYIAGYLVFGCLLLVAVQTLHQHIHNLHTGYAFLLTTASAFGFIWVVLMMCSGMIALVGLHTVVNLVAEDIAQAETVLLAYTVIVSGLGGGIELVGGLWVLLLSYVTFKTGRLPTALSLYGMLVGSIGVLTIYQGISAFKPLFGLTQIIWFIWLGMTLLRALHAKAPDKLLSPG